MGKMGRLTNGKRNHIYEINNYRDTMLKTIITHVAGQKDSNPQAIHEGLCKLFPHIVIVTSRAYFLGCFRQDLTFHTWPIKIGFCG